MSLQFVVTKLCLQPAKDAFKMLFTMNDSDINRFKVIQDVCDHRIRRVDAADILD